MTIEEIREKIENTGYHDARVKSLDILHFGDEVKLTFEDNGDMDITYHFTGCYKASINHVLGYRKDVPVRELNTPQIPYFIQAVEMDEVILDGNRYINMHINMHPVEISILATEVFIV